MHFTFLDGALVARPRAYHFLESCSRLIGTKGYGQRQGFLMVPARVEQSTAPFLSALAEERTGVCALWI